MMAEGMATDYNVVYALSAVVKDMLAGVRKVTTRRISVTSEAGTNLIVDTLPDLFPWVASEPVKRGSMTNFPDGEVFCHPFNVNGTAIVDGCVGDDLCAKYGDLSKTPVLFEIQNSFVVDIVCPGNRTLQQELREYVWNEDGTRELLTRKIGEFALGTNIGLKEVIGKLLQDEKLGNAVHFAPGDPLAHAGTRAGYACKGHLDSLVIDPTVRVEGDVIMDKGKYTREVMERTLELLPQGYALSSDGLSFVAPAA